MLHPNRRFRLTFATLMLVVLLSAIDATVLATALPTIVGDLHGVRDIAWVTTAFMLAQLAVAPIYGKLGDIYGSKLVLQAAIVIFLAGSVLSGLSQTMLELIAARALQGAGAGGLMVLVQTIVSTLVAPRERAKYQSLFAAVYGVASVGGPLLGGVLVQQLSWRWIFFVNVPVGLVAEIVLAVVLQAPPRRRTAPIDWRGAAAIAGGLSCFAVLVTLAGNSFAWVSWQSLLLAVAALTLAAAAYRAERAAADPVIPATVVRNPVFRNGLVQTAAIGAVMFGLVTFTPLYFQVVKGDSPTLAGVLLAAMMAGMISAGLWSGARVSRTGRYRRYPILGFAAMGTGLLMLATIGVGTATALVCIALAIAGAGLGMTMQLILTIVQSALPRGLMGTTTSAMQVGRGTGNSIGPALLGAIFAGGLGRAAAIANTGLHSHIGTGMRDAYVHALRPVYAAATAFAVIGLAAAWRLDELPLAPTLPADAAGPAAAADTPAAATARAGTMVAAGTRVEQPVWSAQEKP
jgi:MFS family permease